MAHRSVSVNSRDVNSPEAELLQGPPMSHRLPSWEEEMQFEEEIEYMFDRDPTAVTPLIFSQVTSTASQNIEMEGEAAFSPIHEMTDTQKRMDILQNLQSQSVGVESQVQSQILSEMDSQPNNIDISQGIRCT